MDGSGEVWWSGELWWSGEFGGRVSWEVAGEEGEGGACEFSMGFPWFSRHHVYLGGCFHL
jgi:hypothetical protein